MADIFSEYLGMGLHIMNIYGPYHRQVKFWEDIMRSSFLQVDIIILGGDLNLSIGHERSWGNHAQINSHSDYFVQSSNTKGGRNKGSYRRSWLSKSTSFGISTCLRIKTSILTRLRRRDKSSWKEYDLYALDHQLHEAWLLYYCYIYSTTFLHPITIGVSICTYNKEGTCLSS